jgi:hypothetical protein
MEFSLFKPHPTAAVLLVCLIMLFARDARATLLLEFQEDLGNFPDAIAVGGGVTERDGRLGVLFTLENTSFTADGFSAFLQDPDGDFANNDVLTTAAATDIAARQPYGIYSFNVKLPDEFNFSGVEAGVKKPDLFGFTIENSDDAGFKEFIFTLGLDPAKGLLFDDAAIGSIPTIFIDPRTGVLEFFIPAPATLSAAEVISLIDVHIRNSPGLDIATELAWVENGVVTTEFPDGNQNYAEEELRPRGEIQGRLVLVPLPAPDTIALFVAGLFSLYRLHARQKSSGA